MQRLFRPDAFENERVLLDLLDDLEYHRRTDELCRSFGQGLFQGLEPRALHLFVRRSKRLWLAWSSDRPLDPRILFPDDPRLLQLAEGWGEAKAADGLPHLDGDERSLLRQWDTDWIVPICNRGNREDARRLVGLLLIGCKQGQSFSTVQRDLLLNLGERMASSFVAATRAEVEALRVEQGQGSWLKECPRCQRVFGREVFFCPADDSVTEPTILLDRLIDSRYLLEKKLGRGGMGAVYRAVDQESGKDVAVKILTGADQVALSRFANETRVGRTIAHPSITQVLGSGSLGRQGAYMAMEYVQGRTLRAILDDEAPIHPQRLARWFDQILAGAHHAHGQGVIHRDLKPDNIMVIETADGEERIKLLDFGLAKLRDAGGTHALTAAGMVIGTLSYMSPEQLAAEAIDHRTDIFALGAMASEALTGKLPFFASNLGQMLRAVATQPYKIEVETLSQAKVADILGKALAKAPGDRYGDAESFRQALIPALQACDAFSAPPNPAP